jgi:subtilase family serine protease
MLKNKIKTRVLTVFLAVSFILQAFSMGVPVVVAAPDLPASGDNNIQASQLFPAGPPVDWSANPPIHIHRAATTSPTGLTPAQIRTVYNIPSAGGSGTTIAIIDAYDYPTAETDLGVFSTQYSLPPCTSANGCFKKVLAGKRIQANSGWALEAALDTQWAHAIAPNASIVLVEARSASLTDLLAAVDVARNLPGNVVAISMSWGGGEFSNEQGYDSHFIRSGATFFASSGDSGYGVSWPAVSSNVVGVGGTSLTFNSDGTVSETAWSGSGGGLSKYESEPSYQSTFGVSNTNSMRAVPDVSYNAAPNSAFSIYDSTLLQGQKGWFQVYGTSAGAPQWAAIKSLGLSASNDKFYTDAKTAYASYFRDIKSGTNGACGFYCTASTGYDYVTGLGSPLTTTY